MKAVVNMSHPLTAEAVSILEKMLNDTISVIEITVQIDMAAPVKPQVGSLLAKVPALVDAIILPGLSYIAGPIAALLSYSQDAMLPVPPAIVVMKPKPGVTPPTFVPTEVMKW